MSWLDRLFSKKEASGSVAKNRLKMVLIHDRNNISPGLLELIKDDIIQVIVKHLDVTPETVEVSLTKDANENMLVAEVPLTSGRRSVETPS